VAGDDVHLAEVKAELGRNAFGALVKGRYGRDRTECRITTSRMENATASLVEIGKYVAVWIPHEALPNGTEYVDRLSQFSPLGFDFTVHRRGTVKRPIYLATAEAAQMTIALGVVKPLPPHAYLSGYDVGDTVLITDGAMMGQVGRVRTVNSGGSYSLANLGWVSIGDHRGEFLAAVFPDGDYGRYEEIQPGNVRFPPGTRVVYAGEPGFIVLTWLRGLARLYRIEEGLRQESIVVAAKQHLRAE